MTKGEDFIKRGKCKNNHCSSMSNSAWRDLNSKGNILTLHDKCPKPNCKCQKIIIFTPHQYMLEMDRSKVNYKIFLKVQKLLGINF